MVRVDFRPDAQELDFEALKWYFALGRRRKLDDA
jgi:hypothetical protein